MTTATHMHRPAMATATYSEGVSWLSLTDDEGNSVTIFTDFRVAVAMADAFNEAQEKQVAYERDEDGVVFVAEGV